MFITHCSYIAGNTELGVQSQGDILDLQSQGDVW